MLVVWLSKLEIIDRISVSFSPLNIDDDPENVLLLMLITIGGDRDWWVAEEVEDAENGNWDQDSGYPSHGYFADSFFHLQ